MPLLSIIPIPSTSDLIASTSAVTLPILNDIYPALIVVGGLGIVIAIVSWVGGLFRR